MNQNAFPIRSISRRGITVVFLVMTLLVSHTHGEPKWSANKKALVASVDKHEKNLIAISDKIWSYAELALAEHQSAKALSDYAEQNGFKVERGVAGMPTAFITSPSSVAVAGVSSDGFTTTVLPQASAGATFHVISSSGRFHGETIATTPKGRAIA